jgi:hypothetical protein
MTSSDKNLHSNAHFWIQQTICYQKKVQSKTWIYHENFQSQSVSSQKKSVVTENVLIIKNFGFFFCFLGS